MGTETHLARSVVVEGNRLILLFPLASGILGVKFENSEETRFFAFRAGISRKAAIGSDEESKMATRKAKIRCRARGDRKLIKQLFNGMSTLNM